MKNCILPNAGKALFRLLRKTHCEPFTSINDFLAIFLTGLFGSNDCDCPAECEKVLYSSSHSAAYFPSGHYWDSIFQILNTSANNITKDIKSYLQETIRLDECLIVNFNQLISVYWEWTFSTKICWLKSHEQNQHTKSPTLHVGLISSRSLIFLSLTITIRLYSRKYFSCFLTYTADRTLYGKMHSIRKRNQRLRSHS